MSDPQRLDALVTRRDQESQKDVAGLWYVYWAVMNILGVWIDELFWGSLMFWALWIPLGVVLMSVILFWKTKNAGRSFWGRIVVPQIWSASLIFLPFLIWLFPEVLHLYSLGWVFPLTSAWVALGMYATGVFNRQLSIALGAVVFCAAAPVFLLFPYQGVWIFTIANVLGLLIPGLVARHAHRR